MDHTHTRVWTPVCLQATGGNTRSFLGVWGEEKGTSRVLHRTSLITRQAVTFAPCVSRFPVWRSCRLTLPSSEPPTYVFPHFGWFTRVPRLMPCDSVPPYGLRLPPRSACKRCN